MFLKKVDDKESDGWRTVTIKAGWQAVILLFLGGFVLGAVLMKVIG
jgi:hypothetical protein